MKNNETRAPQRGPGMRGGTGEKAKNFKGAITRLFKELKIYHIIIIIALFLAMLSSIF